MPVACPTEEGLDMSREPLPWRVILSPGKDCWVVGTVLGRDEPEAVRAARQKYGDFLGGRKWAVRPARP
jgi:hypothetical protein